MDVTKKAFASKYFISNNGRIAPRLVRKLPNSTKLLYAETKLLGNTKPRRERRQNKSTKIEEFIKQDQLADHFKEELTFVDKKESNEEKDHELNDETATLDEQSVHTDERNDLETSEEEDDESTSSSEFDESFSDESVQLESSNKNAARTRRRIQISDDED